MFTPRGFQFVMLGAGVALLAVFDVFVFHGAAARGVVGVIKHPAAYLYANVSFIRESIRMVTDFRDLADENRRLRIEVADLEHAAAYTDELTRENEALRKALAIPMIAELATTDASIFQVTTTPTAVQALINRGSTSGVVRGDAVTTPQGALVGIVREVYDRHAVVQLSIDPAFEITVRVRGAETSGIARGAGTRGMQFDLVVQDDTIVEGDTVVSVGSDLVPAALVVGTVANVETNETKLFKEVRIEPSWDRLLTGVVFVLHAAQ